jgi:hypothetical protein
MVDNDKQSSIPLQSMQKPEDVDEFSPNDTLEIKSVRGSYELRGGGGFVLCG